MGRKPWQSLELFYCYVRKDRTFRDDLDSHLAGLRRSGLIRTWYDGEISPGTPWEQAIKTHLDSARVILLLVSSDFLNSDYCYSKEMTRALERHLAEEVCVIPVLLRPADWSDTPFSTLQVLPSEARPVTSWSDRDAAFEDIAKGVRRAVNEFLNKAQLKHLQKELAFAEKKGYLEKSEFEKIVEGFKDIFSEEEIHSYIKVPVKVSDSEGTGMQQLDSTIFKSINDSLRFLQKSDLYDLLGMSATDSTQALSEAAEMLAQNMIHLLHKKPDVTTTIMLARYARVIFKTDEMRRKYDVSRQQSRLTALLEEYTEEVYRRSKKGLASEQVTRFLEHATREGWSREEAWIKLQEYAHQHEWFLELPVQEKPMAFGIDFGATSSCIAYVDEYGQPNIIPNEIGERMTPSVVLFESINQIVVGKEAKASLDVARYWATMTTSANQGGIEKRASGEA